MNYKKIQNFFDSTSKVCAVLAAPSIVLSTAATVILFPATVIFSFLGGNLREKFNLIIRNPIAWSLLIFYAMFLIGVTYSVAPWHDIFRALRKYDEFLFAVMFIPIFTDEKWRKYAVNAFLGGILIMLLFSYLREFGLHYWPHNGPTSVFKPSIEFNFLLAFGAYLCLFKITTNRCCRWLWVAFFLFLIHTILFRSVGRSGYFVFAGLLGLFFLQKFRWKGLVGAVFGIAILFAAAFTFSPTFKGRIENIYSDVKMYKSNIDTSVGARVQFVRNGLILIKSNPVIGGGTGSYTVMNKQIEEKPRGAAVDNPHNEYIYIAVQFGIIGLLILFAFFASHIWYARFLPEKYRCIAYGAILGIMLGSLANSWLLDVTEGHFYAYFIALTFAALSFRVKSES